MKRLKVGDKVVAYFLGSPYTCTVEVVNKSSIITYKLKTRDGTFLPNAQWEKKCIKDKKGQIVSPWYIKSYIKHENNTK